MDTKILLQLIDEMLTELGKISKKKKLDEKEIGLILEINKKMAMELEK